MNFFHKFFSQFQIIWILVRRDYALQYAGSAFGIAWMLIQNGTLILLYAFVFLYLNLKNPTTQHDYSGYVFSGLLFWIPLQELLIRGTSILTDNRQLIKRSSLGVSVFIWIPYIQYLIHYALTSFMVIIILSIYSDVNWLGFVISYFWMALIGIYVLFLINYLCRVNILLKDISPLVRLLSQILFWGLPILYYPFGILEKFNQLNPLNYPLDIFRSLLITNYQSQFHFYEFLPFLAFSILIFYFSKYKFQKVVMDHL
ncbi:MAG: ABC transporter permease [Leptospira sp.]|nr:ABC transporter permease [Leptospira sp.]NCS93330.1 ABC transporter permease [Leptospira sp.]